MGPLIRKILMAILSVAGKYGPSVARAMVGRAAKVPSAARRLKKVRKLLELVAGGVAGGALGELAAKKLFSKEEPAPKQLFSEEDRLLNAVGKLITVIEGVQDEDDALPWKNILLDPSETETQALTRAAPELLTEIKKMSSMSESSIRRYVEGIEEPEEEEFNRVALPMVDDSSTASLLPRLLMPQMHELHSGGQGGPQFSALFSISFTGDRADHSPKVIKELSTPSGMQPVSPEHTVRDPRYMLAFRQPSLYFTKETK